MTSAGNAWRRFRTTPSRDGGVARDLSELIERRRKPGMIVWGNGAEFTCNAMPAWSENNQIAWHFIAPGKLMQTAFAKASTAGCATSF
jgi:transposase InsO family protein